VDIDVLTRIIGPRLHIPSVRPDASQFQQARSGAPKTPAVSLFFMQDAHFRGAEGGH
jgi:hypothetical protein